MNKSSPFFQDCSNIIWVDLCRFEAAYWIKIHSHAFPYQDSPLKASQTGCPKFNARDFLRRNASFLRDHLPVLNYVTHIHGFQRQHPVTTSCDCHSIWFQEWFWNNPAISTSNPPSQPNLWSNIFHRSGGEFVHLLTVTVSPEPTLMTESASFLIESLKSFMSLRVHMEAAAMGGNWSTKRQQKNTPKNIETQGKCHTCRTSHLSHRRWGKKRHKSAAYNNCRSRKLDMTRQHTTVLIEMVHFFHTLS